MQGLGGLPGDGSQGFLPLTGSLPPLQPGGLGSLFDFYSQSEENAARREMQQGSTFVDNLLPNTWDTVRNGGGPNLDAGLPDWNPHVSHAMAKPLSKNTLICDVDSLRTTGNVKSGWDGLQANNHYLFHPTSTVPPFSFLRHKGSQSCLRVSWRLAILLFIILQGAKTTNARKLSNHISRAACLGYFSVVLR
jgi:hypothetical protein